jgi:hypothetical protein
MNISARREEASNIRTLHSEIEVDSLEKHAEMTQKSSEMKEFQEAMKGYHDLVDHGRREIYRIEK